MLHGRRTGLLVIKLLEKTANHNRMSFKLLRGLKLRLERIFS